MKRFSVNYLAIWVFYEKLVEGKLALLLYIGVKYGNFGVYNGSFSVNVSLYKETESLLLEKSRDANRPLFLTIILSY